MKTTCKFALLWFSSFCFLASLSGAEAKFNSSEHWIKRSQQQNLERFQVKAYAQLASIHKCHFKQWDYRGSIYILSFDKKSKQPMDILHAMGLKVLPILAEALSDESPSQTVTNVRRSRKRVWKVNELVARLIRRLADREFVIGEWGEEVSLSSIGQHPELAPAFQKLVRDWYTKNKGRSVEERKISDLQSNLCNRLDAMMWLGKHKSTKAVPSIVARIEKILGDKTVSSSTHSELAEASLSLGRIGAPSALSAVRKACEHLSYWQGRSSTGSHQEVTLFTAYHGMALLGKKQQALAELRRLLREYGKKMEDHSRKEYEKLLDNAKGWGETPSYKKLRRTR